MAVNENMALEMVKHRLNRLPGDTSLDTYLTARIEAAVQELTRVGIVPTESTEDLILVVDYTVWQYQNRDNPGGMPEWLRLRRRERWLTENDP
jgi:hypothetical protein